MPHDCPATHSGDSQHTPSAQNPDAQCWPMVHGAAFWLGGAHCPIVSGMLQNRPGGQAASRQQNPSTQKHSAADTQRTMDGGGGRSMVAGPVLIEPPLSLPHAASIITRTVAVQRTRVRSRKGPKWMFITLRPSGASDGTWRARLALTCFDTCGEPADNDICSSYSQCTSEWSGTLEVSR
jgi:hypothetical protein